MNTGLLRSPRLKKGDLVRLVSPASYPPESDIEVNKKILEDWGLRCDAGRHVLDKYVYMAGSIDLNEWRAPFLTWQKAANKPLYPTVYPLRKLRSRCRSTLPQFTQRIHYG